MIIVFHSMQGDTGDSVVIDSMVGNEDNIVITISPITYEFVLYVPSQSFEVLLMPKSDQPFVIKRQ